MMIAENDIEKICRSKNYNYNFNKKTGFFARWGKTLEDDPEYAPMPEIMDLEISQGGNCLGNCRWCYKSNGEDQPTHNMSFEEFKIIFHKIKRNLGQIAFGIMNISTNSDFFKMMRYAKEHGVIPNYTCHGLDVTYEVAKETAELCGAVAVSIVNKEKSYDAIEKFSIVNNMKQCNIHYVLCEESYDRAFEIIDDISTDTRLKNLNAVVFLQYKNRGKNPDLFHSVLNIEKYKKLINYCQEKKVNCGFDSCSANLYLETIKDSPNRKQLEMYADPCESELFSFYINCFGVGFPCSFVEGIEPGLDVLHCNNFKKEIWDSEVSKKWRKKLLDNKRNCPIYNLEIRK